MMAGVRWKLVLFWVAALVQLGTMLRQFLAGAATTEIVAIMLATLWLLIAMYFWVELERLRHEARAVGEIIGEALEDRFGPTALYQLQQLFHQQEQLEREFSDGAEQKEKTEVSTSE